MKRNVELELEAVHALQAQGVPIRHGNEDVNVSSDEVESGAACLGGSKVYDLPPTPLVGSLPSKFIKLISFVGHPCFVQYLATQQGEM